MWFSLAKMALKTGANVYANKQKQKEAMSAAALLTTILVKGLLNNFNKCIT